MSLVRGRQPPENALQLQLAGVPAVSGEHGRVRVPVRVGPQKETNPAEARSSGPGCAPGWGLIGYHTRRRPAETGRLHLDLECNPSPTLECQSPLSGSRGGHRFRGVLSQDCPRQESNLATPLMTGTPAPPGGKWGFVTAACLWCGLHSAPMRSPAGQRVRRSAPPSYPTCPPRESPPHHGTGLSRRTCGPSLQQKAPPTPCRRGAT